MRSPLLAPLLTVALGFLTAALGFLAAPRAAAQSEALPDLTPREFEIRGDLQVDFSNIRRQPLTGFGPPPRAYVVPAERTPTERPYAFPIEQIEPPALDAQPVPKPDLLRPLSGLAEGLAGTYAARAARLRLQRTGGARAFYLDADYDGASTFQPFAAAVSDGTAIYNRARGRAGFRTVGAVRFALDVEGGFLDHELYGAALAPAGLPAGAALPDQPTRTTLHGAATARLARDRSYALTLRYEAAAADTDRAALAPARAAALGPDPSEGRLTADAEAEVRRLTLDGHVSIASAEAALGSDVRGSDVRGYSAGGALRLRARGALRLAVGARLLGADGPLPSTSLTAGPLVRFELQPARSLLRVFASNEPRVVDQGLRDLLTTNPFARAPVVMPEVQPVNLRGGVQTQVGPARATLYGGARWGENARYFERNAQTGLFTVAYGAARRYFGGVELAAGVAERLEATVGVELRTGRLTDLDADLPYYAPVVGHAALVANALGERVRLELSARAEGARPADTAGGEAPGFLDLSAEATYRLTDRLDVVVRGGGLAGEVERWEGYPEAPFTVLGGLRARW